MSPIEIFIQDLREGRRTEDTTFNSVYQIVRKKCMWDVFNIEDREDILHNIFIKIYETNDLIIKNNIETEKDLLKFIISQKRNEIKKFLRYESHITKKKKNPREKIDKPIYLEGFKDDKRPLPPEILFEKQKLEDYYNCIDSRLTDKVKEVILELTINSNLSAIARKLNIKWTIIHTLVRNAVKILKACMESKGYTRETI